MALRFKKNGICLSTGAGGGEERAERRVEFELRRAITMQSTSNRKVVPSPITTNQNSCKSFHDTMIEELNGERTGESSNMTTCIIVNFQDYLKKPYFPWSTDPLNYCLSEKSSGSIRPLLMWSKKICIPATSVPSEMLFSATGDLILDQRSRLSTYHVDILLFLNKNACSQKLTFKSSGLKSLWGMGN
ncbi:hypothetical protein DAPPUDRAFT_317904 [Daphnia pulex]|uniref:HAT C-terminal dimerisation domain-containing protein n=1 Tax=Daphnia pulex TaxID=6669 RepID=E9GHB0_DAPPU|nr:hypothetical protein DAPPUDRAFT_317904 [Daphnia pulex]|eukprot:EFX81213.1 hypothetical protein DAPPUDRAFT_317904 [Daphnia pulex]